MDEIIEMVDEEQQYLEGCKDIYLQEGHYWAVPYASTCGKLMYTSQFAEGSRIRCAAYKLGELLDMAKTFK